MVNNIYNNNDVATHQGHYLTTDVVKLKVEFLTNFVKSRKKPFN